MTFSGMSAGMAPDATVRSGSSASPLPVVVAVLHAGSRITGLSLRLVPSLIVTGQLPGHVLAEATGAVHLGGELLGFALGNLSRCGAHRYFVDYEGRRQYQTANASLQGNRSCSYS